MRERSCRSLTAPCRVWTTRREGSEHRVPADRAAATASRGTERAGRAAGRRGLRGLDDIRRALSDTHRRPSCCRWAALQPVPHHCAVRPDAAGAAHRPQPPFGRHRQYHRARDILTGQQLAPPEHQGSAGDHLEAQRLLDRTVRQVPRGAGVATCPMGPFDAWPTGGGGFESFYGFIGGENNQWDPALYSGTTPIEPPATAEEGYHLTEDLHRPRHRLGAPAEGVDAGPAVLHLLRPRRHPRPAPRPEGVGRPLPGRVRRRLERLARDHLRPPEGTRGHPGRRRADRTAR